MRRGRSVVWDLVKPLLIYYVGYYAVYMVVGTLLAGGGMSFLMEEGRAVVNGIAMLGGLAVLFPMIEEEREAQQKEVKAASDNFVLKYLALVVFAAASVIFFNMLVSYLNLAEQSASFRETAKRQFAVSPVMGLFLYAGVAAAVEETVFRFLLYNRIRRFGGSVLSGVFVSAFLFAVYHGNVVQGVYAFALGVLIAYAYCYFDNFFAPVLFHGVGNAVIFLGNRIPGVSEAVFTPVMFGVCGMITVVGCWVLVREGKDSKAKKG